MSIDPTRSLIIIRKNCLYSTVNSENLATENPTLMQKAHTQRQQKL